MYFLVQSWLFSEVSLSPVTEVNQSRPGVKPQTFEDKDQSDLLEENNVENWLRNTTLIEATEDDDSADIDSHAILSRLRRLANPCELKRERKWSNCLGRHFTKVYCVKTHFACLPHNAPPKCKKNYDVIFGKTGRPCRVLKSCTCT